jgi:hypothetical protein
MPVTASRISGAGWLRGLDLLVLALALPVFLLTGAPLVGWAVTAVAWVGGRLGKAWADRRRGEAIAAANRNAALGLTAVAMLGRLWVLAGAILLVGLLADREAGLTAALLAVALVTAYLAGTGLAQLLGGEDVR